MRRLSAWLSGAHAPLLLALLLLGGGVALFLGETPLWWFGGALLAAGATLVPEALPEAPRALWARFTAKRRLFGSEGVAPSRLVLELVYLGIVVTIASVMMSEILGGERPVSHDHTIHYVKAWHLHEMLRTQGSLLGWTHLWFAGYPVNYLYPPGADLWINAVHALGFGAYDFAHAYAYAFWLFHVLTGVSVYAFGRKLGGPHVGLIAAVLCLTDLADFRMGGWAYTVEYGVWPQALSLDFSMLALCSLPGLVLQRSRLSLAAFGLFMGLAIICHPIQLIVLGLLLLGTALAAGFAEGVSAPSAVARLLLGYALSLLVASLWMVPFFSARAETNQMGVWWDTTYAMGKGLLELDAMPGTLGYVLAFGLLGVVVALRTRRFLPLLTAFMALSIPAVSNSSFVDELHLPALAEAFSKVQFVRLSTMVKPFWFVLCAYFLIAALTHARGIVLADHGQRTGVEGRARRMTMSGIVALLTLPVLVPAGEAFWAHHVQRSLTTESDRPYLSDRTALERWLLRRLPKGDGFYRVGVSMGHNHDLLDLGTTLGRPMYKRGFTPASNFIYQPNEREPAIYDAVNLRFMISKVPMPADQFELMEAFGIYKVYRYLRWQPKPFTIWGKGDVRLERFSDEEIALDAKPGASGRLRLHVSYFSRWKAYRDGARVPITVTYLPESADDTGFITVPLAPGKYRFVFERTLGDRASLPLSVLGVALCALLAWSERRRWSLGWLGLFASGLDARLERLSTPAFARARLWLLIGLAALSLVVGIALGRWRPPIAPDGLPESLGKRAIASVRFDFLENLRKASANIEYRDINQPCLRQRDRLVCRDAAGNLDNERYVASSPATIQEYTMVRCIRARPEQDALLSVSFPRVPIGDAVVGYYGIERAGRLMFKRRPVELRVFLDGAPIYQGQTESDNTIYWFNADLPKGGGRGTVTFAVRADNVSKRQFCFHAQVVDLK